MFIYIVLLENAGLIDLIPDRSLECMGFNLCSGHERGCGCGCWGKFLLQRVLRKMMKGWMIEMLRLLTLSVLLGDLSVSCRKHVSLVHETWLPKVESNISVLFFSGATCIWQAAVCGIREVQRADHPQARTREAGAVQEAHWRKEQQSTFSQSSATSNCMPFPSFTRSDAIRGFSNSTELYPNSL